MAQFHAARYITLLLGAAAALHITNYLYYSMYVSERPGAFSFIVDKKVDDGQSQFLKRVKKIASSLSNDAQIKDQSTEDYLNKNDQCTNRVDGNILKKSTLNEGETYEIDGELPTTVAPNTTNIAYNFHTGVPVLDQNYSNNKPYWQEWCPPVPPNLGPETEVKIGRTDPSGALPLLLFTEIKLGGEYKPKHCLARQKVAIIVPYPYLDHYVRLATFLYAIHPFLMKQMLDYRIFVVEQVNETILSMSPGELMNIGFKVAQRERPDWDCFVFHVPELIPKDARNLYDCDSRGPKQLVTWIEPHHIPDKSSPYVSCDQLIV